MRLQLLCTLHRLATSLPVEIVVDSMLICTPLDETETKSHRRFVLVSRLTRIVYILKIWYYGCQGRRTGCWTNGRMDFRTCGGLGGRSDGRSGGRTDGRTDGRSDGGSDARSDGRSEGRPAGLQQSRGCDEPISRTCMLGFCILCVEMDNDLTCLKCPCQQMITRSSF